MVALLDQLDVLSLPPLAFPPDTAFLRSHLLHMLYSVGKGRLLLLRCLMRLPHPHTFDIVSILAASLSSTCTPSSPSRVDEQFAVLAADVLYAAPMHTANIAYSHFLQPHSHTQLVALVRAKMGCMFLQVLIKKGQDMSHAYSTQQPGSGSTDDSLSAAPSTSSPPSAASSRLRLSSVSADFAVWLSLTAELLRLLNGQWAAVFDNLPNSANSPAVAENKPNAAAAATVPSAPSHGSLVSARAMWDFVSLLLSHLTATASRSPADDESEQAAQQLAILVEELRPLIRHYLIATYQLTIDGHSTEEAEQAEQAAHSAGTASSPATAATVVAAAAAAAGQSTSPPKLLPLPHSSLLYACSVLLPPSDPILPAAQAAHRRSEEKVRAFIATKQARLNQHYSTRQRGQHHHHAAAAAVHRGGGVGGTQTAWRGLPSRGGPQHLGHNSHAQQRRGSPTQQQFHQSNQPAIGAQQTATSKSQPGSYAFAAAGKA